MRLRVAAISAAAVSTAVISTVITTLPRIPAVATTAMNTVSGLLTYEDGRPAANQPVVLNAKPRVELAVGTAELPTAIATTTTDATGHYTLTITPTATLVAMAQDNEGTLNADVVATIDQVPSVPLQDSSEDQVQVAVKRVLLPITADPLSSVGFSFTAPGAVDIRATTTSVSVNPDGTDMTVSASTADAGTPTPSSSPQPEPDPESDATTTVDNTATAAGEAQDDADEATGVGTGGVVGVDSVTVDSVADAAGNATGSSSIVNDVRAYENGGGGSGDPHYYPSNPCVDDYNYQTYWISYVTYTFDDWVTIGELHVPSDATGWLRYQTSSKTTVGFGIKYPGKGWSVSGSSKVSKTRSSWNGVRFDGPFGRHIKSKFGFEDRRHYYCKPGEGSRRQYVASYYDTRDQVAWRYSMLMGSVDLRNWQSRTHFDRARNDGRAESFQKYETPGKASGDGYNYTFEVNILGAVLGAETDFSTNTELRWEFKGHRSTYWLFGNNAHPLDAKITYSYG